MTVGMVIGVGILTFLGRNEDTGGKIKIPDEKVDLDKMRMEEGESRKVFELRKIKTAQRKFKKYTDLLENGEQSKKIIDAISQI